MMKESIWNGMELRRSEILVEKRGTNKSKSSVGAAQFHIFTISSHRFTADCMVICWRLRIIEKFLFLFRTFVSRQKYKRETKEIAILLFSAIIFRTPIICYKTFPNIPNIPIWTMFRTNNFCLMSLNVTQGGWFFLSFLPGFSP